MLCLHLNDLIGAMTWGVHSEVGLVYAGLQQISKTISKLQTFGFLHETFSSLDMGELAAGASFLAGRAGRAKLRMSLRPDADRRRTGDGGRRSGQHHVGNVGS